MRIKGIVKYKGTNYFGWQKQDNRVTVEGKIEEILSKILDTEVNILASGRTDAGVHALGQVFHFDVEKEVDLEKLLYATNSLLPKDIAICSFEEVSNDFQARYSAKGKHYRYIIDFNKKNPFTFESSYNCLFPTNLELLKEALLSFIGKHDFKDFTAKEEDEQGFIRTISDIQFTEENNVVTIDLFGDGFMRYMIRFIVGSSLAVAWGKENLEYIHNHLSNKINREVVCYKAPPQGLYLVKVFY